MKKVMSFVALIFLAVLVLLPILFVYRVIFEIEWTTITAALGAVCSFPFFIILCRYGQKEIKKQERLIVTCGNRTASDKRILVLCFMCMSPVYWAVLMVALIPIVRPGMFFLTLFPAFLVSCIPTKAVCDTYRSFTSKRLAFCCIHAAIMIFLALIGQIPSQLFLTR